ncbi:conserved hypothetical protein [Streptomyces clavuligerus]|nr:conserved hypothetical protein [Streptomyces clavuligerus]
MSLPLLLFRHGMPPAVWNAQQAALHQALRTVLSAHGFRIQDGSAA